MPCFIITPFDCCCCCFLLLLVIRIFFHFIVANFYCLVLPIGRFNLDRDITLLSCYFALMFCFGIYFALPARLQLLFAVTSISARLLLLFIRTLLCIQIRCYREFFSNDNNMAIVTCASIEQTQAKMNCSSFAEPKTKRHKIQTEQDKTILYRTLYVTDWPIK